MKRFRTDEASMVYHRVQCGISLGAAGLELALFFLWGSVLALVLSLAWFAWFAFVNLPRYRSAARWHDANATKVENSRQTFDKIYYNS